MLALTHRPAGRRHLTRRLDLEAAFVVALDAYQRVGDAETMMRAAAATPAGSHRGEGTAFGSFAVDFEVAELREGVGGISGSAEMVAKFPTSLFSGVAESGWGSDQVDEVRPDGAPNAAILKEMEAVGDGAYVCTHGCVLRQVQASEGSRLRTTRGGQALASPVPLEDRGLSTLRR